MLPPDDPDRIQTAFDDRFFRLFAEGTDQGQWA